MSPPNLSFAALWIPSLVYILYVLFLNPSFQSIKITCSHRPHHSDHLNSSEVPVLPNNAFLHLPFLSFFIQRYSRCSSFSWIPTLLSLWPRDLAHHTEGGGHAVHLHSSPTPTPACRASLHPPKSLSLSPFLPLLKLFSSMASPQISGRGRVNIHWPRQWIWYFIHCSIQSFRLVHGFSSRSLHGESTCPF